MLYKRAAAGYNEVAFDDTAVPAAITPDTDIQIVQAEMTDLEMPASIWIMMFAAYAIFFGGLIAATAHDNGTAFVIVISILYTMMYFGVASVLFKQNNPEQPSLFARGLAPLQTYTGPMGKSAVVGQVLTIPACLAIFGVAMAIFRSVIFR